MSGSGGGHGVVVRHPVLDRRRGLASRFVSASGVGVGVFLGVGARSLVLVSGLASRFGLASWFGVGVCVSVWVQRLGSALGLA